MPDTDPNLPTNPGTPPAGTSRFFTQEELNEAIERARQQEKTKLYGTIEKTDERYKALDTEVKELRSIARKAEKQEADRLAAVEAERKRAEEAEMSARDLIDRRNAEFDAQMQAFRQEQELKIAMLEKENELTKLAAYIQRRINEESDNIAPELLDFIGGDTQEAVEASIAKVKASTTSIVENMRTVGVRQRAAMPGVAPAAGTNGVGPMDTPGNRELSADDIKGMGMAEFSELRKRIGMGGASNQGLFRA